MTTPSLDRIAPQRPPDLIRVGRQHDGGYIVSARTIGAANVLIGMGINTDWSFEAEFSLHNTAASVVMIDGSVSGGDFARRAIARTVDAAWHRLRGKRSLASRAMNEASIFWRCSRDLPRFLRDPRRTFVPRMIHETSFAGGITIPEVLALADTVAPAGGARCFIKMDVEGEEYRLLPQLRPAHDRITGMAIEFHNCDIAWPRFLDLVDAIREDFVLVHVHGNNSAPIIPETRVPQVLELSFASRCLVAQEELDAGGDIAYPLADLDQPNDPIRADYPLDFSADRSSSPSALSPIS